MITRITAVLLLFAFVVLALAGCESYDERTAAIRYESQQDRLAAAAAEDAKTQRERIRQEARLERERIRQEAKADAAQAKADAAAASVELEQVRADLELALAREQNLSRQQMYYDAMSTIAAFVGKHQTGVNIGAMLGGALAAGVVIVFWSWIKAKDAEIKKLKDAAAWKEFKEEEKWRNLHE